MPFNYNCSHCGEVFTRHARKKTKNKFCSNKCYHDFTIKQFKIKCKRCSKPYSTLRKDRLYCNRECYETDKKPEMITKLCPVCNKHFTIPKKYTDRFKVCSYECRIKYTIYKKCKRCGKTFTCKKEDVNRYCSEECYRPPILATCKKCGVEFRMVPSAKKLFCSFFCYRSFIGETSIEIK
ncbi:hypothetical protein LCGC14_2385030, partial [marine sediment metagenome]